MSFNISSVSFLKDTLTSDTIKKLLRSVRHSQPLPTKSIAQLHIVKSAIPDGLPKPVYDHLLIELLATRIISNVNLFHVQHDLPAISRTAPLDETLKHLENDFTTSDMHLQAWSILHYSFIRVDLHLTTHEWEKHTLLSSRTLRRRRKKGYDLLLIDLLMNEMGH